MLGGIQIIYSRHIPVRKIPFSTGYKLLNVNNRRLSFLRKLLIGRNEASIPLFIDDLTLEGAMIHFSNTFDYVDSTHKN